MFTVLSESEPTKDHPLQWLRTQQDNAHRLYAEALCRYMKYRRCSCIFFKGPTAILGVATTRDCWLYSRPGQPSSHSPITGPFACTCIVIYIHISIPIDGPGVPTVLMHGTCAQEKARSRPCNDAQGRYGCKGTKIRDYRRCSLLSAACVIFYLLPFGCPPFA